MENEEDPVPIQLEEWSRLHRPPLRYTRMAKERGEQRPYPFSGIRYITHTPSPGYSRQLTTSNIPCDRPRTRACRIYWK